MKLLKTIYETDIGLKDTKLDIDYNMRDATRAVVLNDKNEVAILHVVNLRFHTLPGGGIEKGENIIDSLKREVLEETGYEIGNIKELGKIISYRNKYKVVQNDYGYIAKTVKKLQEPEFSKGELDEGMVLKWCNINSAIKLFQKDNSSDYIKKYKIVRDLTYLEKVNEDLERE